MAPRGEIRIPTFASPVARQRADLEPKTRDEERQARLKGPTGQWNDFGSLFRGRVQLPDELLKPRPPQTTTSTAAGAQSPRRGESSPSKRRKSDGKRKGVHRELEVVEEELPIDDGDGDGDGAAAGLVHGTSVEVEVQRELERHKVKSPKRKRAPPAVAARVPSPEPSPELSAELGDPVFEMEDFAVETNFEDQPPVASSSKVPAGPKRQVKPAKPLAVLQKAASMPKPPRRKRPARVADSEEAEDNEVPVAGPSNAAKRPNKTPRTVAQSPSPTASDDDDPLADTADRDSGSDAGDSDADDGASTQKGTRVRTERLASNKGKLNAIDIAYGPLSRLVQHKAAGLNGKSAKALQRYSALLQVLLLSQSDQISTLAARTAQVQSARSAAKQLRTDLLGIQRARAGVRRRLANEEEKWRASRKRIESTRRLHGFMGDLGHAAIDLDAVAGGASGRIKEAVEPRLRRLVDLVGGDAKGKGRLLGRVNALNRELERV